MIWVPVSDFSVMVSIFVFSSMNPSHLTIVGAGADAVLSISGNTFKLGSNTKIDNITLKSERAPISSPATTMWRSRTA